MSSKLPSWLPISLITGPFHALFPPPLPADTLPVAARGARRAAWKARKLLFRCSIITLSCFILLLEPRSLAILGNAAFFGCIVSVMLPAIMPAMMFIFAMATLLIGMLLGWAWSSAAMAAALQARNKVLLASQFQRVQASVAGATNPEALYQVSIFKGDFLDARAVVVFGVFLGVGTFTFGYLRAIAPKMTLLALFGTIVCDVMMSYGPLFPFAEYTLATSFLLPTACYLGIATVATFVIFPQTLNSSWTYDMIEKFLIPVLQRSQIHSSLLSSPPPSEDAAAWGALSKKMEASNAAISAGIEGLLGSVGMMELEISHGRMSAKDLKGLTADLRTLHGRAMGLVVFVHHIDARQKKIDEELADQAEHEASHDEKNAQHHEEHHHKPAPLLKSMRSKVLEAENVHSHNLAALLPILQTASTPLRSAGDAALLGAIEWLISINDSRWKKQPSAAAIEEHYKFQKEKIEGLKTALAEYKSSGRLALLAPFEKFFDPETGELVREIEGGSSLTFSPASLLLCLTASCNLVWYSEALIKFLESLSALEDKRRRNKIWWPSGLRKIGNHVGGREKSVEVLTGSGSNPEKVERVGDEEGSEDGGESDASTQVTKVEKKTPTFRKDGRRDPDARPPKNKTQKFTFKLYQLGQWSQTPEAVFAFKYMFVSIALWLPQVFSSSAYFIYTNKGLWALIMAQTGLAVFAGDQISASIQKFCGTLVGLVYGMLIWYIGAGKGLGSRPGLGASLYVFMLPALAMRIFAPPQYQQGAIIAAVTTVLVVGYSWSNGHIVTLGSPGIGYHLAWKRALLVIIGMTAATIVMIFPRPQSARLLVRRTTATCVNELCNLYASIIGAWLSEERIDRLGKSPSDSNETPFSDSAQKELRGKLLSLMIKLRGVKTSIGQAGFEVSLRGDWPAKEYSTLLDSQLAMVESLAQLGVALVRLDPEWRRKLVHRTAFLNRNLISDVTATFSLISMALRSGSPLPENTPGPLLERLIYHENSRQNKKAHGGPFYTDEDHEEHSHHKLEGARIGTRITFGALKDEQFGTYATALLALSAILGNLDTVEENTKKLVGEVLFAGYDRLRGEDNEV